MESIVSPEYLLDLDITLLRGHHFVKYMNLIGRSQDGTFMNLLSTISYHFYERGGQMVTQKDDKEVAAVLSLLIFEL